MPLGVVLRDVLRVAHNIREAKRILHSRKVLVDGKIETDRSRGVGLMDVLTVGEDNFRCVLDTNGKLRYRPITKKSAKSKICRVNRGLPGNISPQSGSHYSYSDEERCFGLPNGRKSHR